MTLGHAGESVADRYRLDRRAGGTPDIEYWEAYDSRLARPVAVRLERVPDGVDEHDDAGRAGDSQSTLTRIARLNHPHVAAVYDVGVVGGPGGARVRYAVSERTDGHTLARIMRTGPQPWPRVADWGRQISAGLIALHGIGIAHGALGPDSVAVFDDRRLKILDAWLEQSAGDEGAAVDVRALAVLLWEAVVGAPPAVPVGDGSPEAGAEESSEAESPEPESAESAGGESGAAELESGENADARPSEDAPRSGAERPAAPQVDTEPLREAGVPPVLVELLVEMLAADPAARPTAAQVEERIAPLVPIERVADMPEANTAPDANTAPGTNTTPGADAAREYPTTPSLGGASRRTQVIRPTATTGGGRNRRRGLIIGLAVLFAGAGVGVGLAIANLTGSPATGPPAVDVTVSSSPGVINFPTPSRTPSSAAPVSTAPQTTEAATSAAPSTTAASASPSVSASPSKSASVPASASPLSSASPAGDASPSAAGGGSPGGTGAPGR